MARDSGFWTWPADNAAGRSGSRRLALAATALYWAGAIALLAQTVFTLPAFVALAGVCLILLGVAGSVGALGTVLLTRSRPSFH